MEVLESLRNIWNIDKIQLESPANELDITEFQEINNVKFPADLMAYFRKLNGTNDQYDANLFQFYSLARIKNLEDEFKNWNGIPRYSDVLKKMEDFDQYYVFANYNIDLFAYAIRLYKENRENDIIAICGGEYRQVSNTFNEFLELYLSQSELLWF